MKNRKFYEKVSTSVDEIEAEMKRVGAWTDKVLDPQLLENMGPFGGRTMPLEYWLQFVFIPRVREIIKNKEAFPEKSQVGVYAAREFDGRGEYAPLVQLLCEFDKLFTKTSRIRAFFLGNG